MMGRGRRRRWSPSSGGPGGSRRWWSGGRRAAWRPSCWRRRRAGRVHRRRRRGPPGRDCHRPAPGRSGWGTGWAWGWSGGGDGRNRARPTRPRTMAMSMYRMELALRARAWWSASDHVVLVEVEDGLRGVLDVREEREHLAEVHGPALLDSGVARKMASLLDVLLVEVADLEGEILLAGEGDVMELRIEVLLEDGEVLVVHLAGRGPTGRRGWRRGRSPCARRIPSCSGRRRRWRSSRGGWCRWRRQDGRRGRWRNSRWRPKGRATEADRWGCVFSWD